MSTVKCKERFVPVARITEHQMLCALLVTLSMCLSIHIANRLQHQRQSTTTLLTLNRHLTRGSMTCDAHTQHGGRPGSSQRSGYTEQGVKYQPKRRMRRSRVSPVASLFNIFMENTMLEALHDHPTSTLVEDRAATYALQTTDLLAGTH